MAAFSSDGRLKFIQNRIDKVEQHFEQICNSTAAYVRILAKLREKGDDVTRAMLTYAESEGVNPTTKAALVDFVEHFSAVEDLRNVQIHRLNTKVIGPMMQYGKSCKRAKERIKYAFAANAKELKKKKSTSDKVTSKNAKEQAQQQGTADAFRANRELEDEIDSFERKKLHDIKSLMSDFVNVELSFHSKALEMFTLCYRSMTLIREDHDLQQFRESLRPLVRHSSGSDTMTNASNSASAGIFRRTPKLAEAVGKQRRPESRQNDRSSSESTSESQSFSSQCTTSPQNEEIAGDTEDGGVNDSVEDDDETEQHSADEKPRRK